MSQYVTLKPNLRLGCVVSTDTGVDDLHVTYAASNDLSFNHILALHFEIAHVILLAGRSAQ